MNTSASHKDTSVNLQVVDRTQVTTDALVMDAGGAGGRREREGLTSAREPSEGPTHASTTDSVESGWSLPKVVFLAQADGYSDAAFPCWLADLPTKKRF